ncbi:MAG: hypothetical protein WC264_02290 [Candidatus Paceibacterota bacterium]|jgi:hypothetical protein
MENQIKNKKVQTYAEDVAKAIESGQGGVIKELIRNQEEQEAQKENLSPESKKNKLFMFVSIILIFLACIVLIVYVVLKERISTVSVTPQFTPIIFTDQNVFLEIGGLNKDKIVQTIFNEVNNTKVKIGGVEGIYLTENKNVVQFRKLTSLIQGNLSLDKVTFLDDNFLLGVVNSDAKPASSAGRDLFILLKMRSIADIFDGMRSWESKMFYDLHGFFGVDINADINYLLTKDFEDGIVENKNARILRDKDGKIVFMYVFADETSLVITNTNIATHEIMLRLAGSQVKK